MDWLAHPVWYYLMSLSVLTLAISAVSGHALAIFTSSAILFCYAMVQVVKQLPINSDYYPVVCAGIWTIASGSILRRFLHRGSNVSALMYAVPVLVALNALCYLWADISNAPRVKGSPPYVVSDILMAVAMLLTWRMFNAQLSDRIRGSLSGFWGLGSNSASYRSGSMADEKGRGWGLEAGKDSEASLAPKVRAHG